MATAHPAPPEQLERDTFNDWSSSEGEASLTRRVSAVDRERVAGHGRGGLDARTRQLMPAATAVLAA